MPPTISLKTLLSALLALIFLLLAAALFLTNLASTRDFLQHQLASHAQDAATTLALQLAPQLASDESAGNPMASVPLAAVANSVDALFDSGYYRHIRIARPAGGTLLAREVPLRLEDTPDWFVRLLPLATPDGEAEAMAGWKRVANIQVASHPGFAYRQLWANARDTLLLSLAFWLLASLLATWLVTRALRGLNGMETLAMAVARGEFPRLAAPPRIRELRHIGDAMNTMSASVGRMLDDKSRLVEKLQADLYHDPQTGLSNRAFFLASLVDTLQEHGNRCGLILLMIDGLGTCNGRQGRAAGDRIIAAVANALRAAEQPRVEHLARIDGTQFAVLLEFTDPEQLRRHAEQLAQDAELALRPCDPDNLCGIHAGAALAAGGDSSTLLAKADAALRDARLGASGTSRQAACHSPGAHDLRQLLRDAVENATLNIEWQPARRCRDEQAAHFEAYARLATPDGRILPAGAFIHLAEEAGLVTTLDRLILAAARRETGIGLDMPRTVNLSITSLLDAAFIAELQEQSHGSPPLLLELPGGRLASASPRARAALGELRQSGHGLILDRFIPSPASLAWLRDLRPDWIKVEGALCRQARTDVGTRAMLNTLCGYARELGCQVGATGVEERDEMRVLCEAGFDAVQGRLFNLEKQPT